MNRIPRLLLLSIILLAITYTTYGQDTAHVAKKTANTTVKPGYRHTSYYYHHADTGKYKSGYYHTGAYAKPADSTNKVAVPPAPVIADNTLAGQYNDALKKMYPYEKTALAGFYKNYMDTLNAQHRKLRDATTKLADMTKTITGLQSDVGSRDQQLSSTELKTGQMSFIGIAISKTAFSYVMWALVLILGGALATVIYLSGANRHEAAHRTQLYDELTAEFAAYKAKANDKEKKLARELQTERNKVDELLGRK